MNPNGEVPSIQADAPCTPEQLDGITMFMMGRAAKCHEKKEYLNGLYTPAKAIESLATGPEFQRIVWRIAVGAVAEYCAKRLQIDEPAQIERYKLGYACNFSIDQSDDALQHSINLGWILTSIVVNGFGKDASYVPPASPLPPEATADCLRGPNISGSPDHHDRG
jgi:hypothetical protein